MCILFIAVNQHPKYPLIIAANRDEFHKRPTQASHFWQGQSDILAGKDLVAGGTWMGINKKGRIAALTNIRAPGKERENAVSRGELVANYLVNHQPDDEYLANLQTTHENYNGYNLLFGNIGSLQVYNSFENTSYGLNNGVYGLSNASLNSPWPKLDAGRKALADYCRQSGELHYEHLFELLMNDVAASDDELPKTGVPIDWERKLSSIFITSEEYGTRSSTILLVDKNHNCLWEERSFDTNAKLIGQQEFKFVIN
ncbi:NRDE family protein [Glaciecola petra]|uniref:NRDE family protein n=1 Tax=Glaciecola petra TaxID=3075602 RepID=A0ABU2ZP11_9ALTE|nr:NRDE family protein [Aestuariibacter sp. P117]MDT0594359.1 NRDE family protein [Aestuariibacter sp. P117]